MLSETNASSPGFRCHTLKALLHNRQHTSFRSEFRKTRNPKHNLNILRKLLVLISFLSFHIYEIKMIISSTYHVGLVVSMFFIWGTAILLSLLTTDSQRLRSDHTKYHTLSSCRIEFHQFHSKLELLVSLCSQEQIELHGAQCSRNLLKCRLFHHFVELR